MHTLKAIRDSEHGITECMIIEWHYTRLMCAWTSEIIQSFQTRPEDYCIINL